MTHSWAVAYISRMVASGTLLVRSCRGYSSVPGSWVGRLVWLPQRPPWRLGDPAPPLPLPCTPVLTHYTCEPVGKHRLVAWQTSACFMASAVWALFSCTASSAFKSSSLQQKTWWPHLWVIALGPHSFSSVAEVAHSTVWLVQPWGGLRTWDKGDAHHLQCLWHGWLEQRVSNVSEAEGSTWCGCLQKCLV